jgi:TonB family protein
MADEPAGVFDKEAEDALKYWSFSPARLSSCGTSVQRAQVTMRFRHAEEQPVQLSPLVVNDIPQLARPEKRTTLEEFRREQAAAASTTGVYDPRSNVPTHRVQPEFPTRALERRKEGMVALSFMIEPDGTVSDVEVVDTVAGYLFQRPSLGAIRQWRFEPRVRNGQRVRAPACHEFIFHVDEYQRSGQLARQRENSNVRSYSPN